MISMLLPTRGRMELCLDCINKSNKIANNIDNIEWLLRVDDDDKESQEIFAQNKPNNAYITIGERYNGYIDFYKYVNEIAKKARGNILWLWNDDVYHLCSNWDKIITEEYNEGEVAVYQLSTGTQFPAISIFVYQILGHFSLCCACDSYIEYVTMGLGISKKLPLMVRHYQGEIIDETWEEEKEHKRQQHKEFWSKEFQETIDINRNKIKNSIKGD